MGFSTIRKWKFFQGVGEISPWEEVLHPIVLTEVDPLKIVPERHEGTLEKQSEVFTINFHFVLALVQCALTVLPEPLAVHIALIEACSRDDVPRRLARHHQGQHHLPVAAVMVGPDRPHLVRSFHKWHRPLHLKPAEEATLERLIGRPFREYVDVKSVLIKFRVITVIRRRRISFFLFFLFPDQIIVYLFITVITVFFFFFNDLFFCVHFFALSGEKGTFSSEPNLIFEFDLGAIELSAIGIAQNLEVDAMQAQVKGLLDFQVICAICILEEEFLSGFTIFDIEELLSCEEIV